MDELKNRVELFQTLQLPGQPVAMHMGTFSLVNDLWREVQQLLRLDSVLRHYADTYCEGWCKDAPSNANFNDCGGCRARLALRLDASAVTSTECGVEFPSGKPCPKCNATLVEFLFMAENWKERTCSQMGAGAYVERT